MRRSPGSMVALSLLLLSVAACGAKKGQAVAPAPVSAPSPAAAPTTTVKATGGPHAPGGVAVYAEIDRPGDFAVAVEKQFAPFGLAARGESEHRKQFAEALGLHTGASIDFSRPVGVFVSFGPTGISPPQLAIAIPAVSAAAARDDLPPGEDSAGHGRALGTNDLGLKVASEVPGGFVEATSQHYLDAVVSTAKERLASAAPAGPPSARVVVDLPRVLAVYGPFLTAEMSSAASASPAVAKSVAMVKATFEKAGQIATISASWVPGGRAVVVDLDVAPLPGTELERLLSLPPIASAPPDGRTIPDSYPIVFTYSGSPAVFGSMGEMYASLFPGEAVGAAMKGLCETMTGLAVGGMSIEPAHGVEMAFSTEYTDIGKARGYMRDVFTGMGPAMASVAGSGTTVSTKIEKDAFRLEKIPVDRLTFDAGKSTPFGTVEELLACAGHQCSLAMGPAARDVLDALLKPATDPTGAGARGTPLTARPGIRETLADLGDVSRGFMYADYAGIAREFTGSTGAPGHRPPAAGHSPGVAFTWSATPRALHVRGAMELGPLAALSTSTP